MGKEKADNKTNDKRGLLGKVLDNPVTTIHSLITVTENSMQQRVSACARYRKKYRKGLQYLMGTTSEGLPIYSTNYIFAMIETIKTNMARGVPPIAVAPKGEGDDLAADILSKILEDSLKNAKLYKKIKDMIHHGAICGIVGAKVGYDPQGEQGDGCNTLDIIPIEDLLIDPTAKSEDEARWVIHRVRGVPVDKIYATYGKLPAKKSTDSEEDTFSDTNLGNTDNMKAARDISDTFDVYECYIHDWSGEGENDWYLVTIAGNTVLRQEYCVYDHNKCPITLWFDLEDDGAENIYLRGVGEVEEIEPLQDKADALDMRIYKNISLLSNRQRYVSSQSGLNAMTMDNVSGRTYQVNGDPSKAVFYDAPPTLSGDVYGYRNQTEMLIQTVSGVFDVTQGRRPVGITAGRAINNLKESSDVRIMDKSESLAPTLVRIGEMFMSNILQFYEKERIVRLTDSDIDGFVKVIGSYPPALQLPEDTSDIPEELSTVRQQFKDEMGIDLVLEDVTFKWDIVINSDSALPKSAIEKAQVASDLFRLGAIDRKALLDMIVFPNRREILKRLGEDVTGKNAGNPVAEAGLGGQNADQLMQMLQQMGIDPNMVQQILSGSAGQGAEQPQPVGNFPAQIAQEGR